MNYLERMNLHLKSCGIEQFPPVRNFRTDFEYDPERIMHTPLVALTELDLGKMGRSLQGHPVDAIDCLVDGELLDAIVLDSTIEYSRFPGEKKHRVKIQYSNTFFHVGKKLRRVERVELEKREGKFLRTRLQVAIGGDWMYPVRESRENSYNPTLRKLVDKEVFFGQDEDLEGFDVDQTIRRLAFEAEELISEFGLQYVKNP